MRDSGKNLILASSSLSSSPTSPFLWSPSEFEAVVPHVELHRPELTVFSAAVLISFGLCDRKSVSLHAVGAAILFVSLIQNFDQGYCELLHSHISYYFEYIT